MVEVLLVCGGVLLALGAWAYLFRLPPEGIWPRTWATAAVLTAYSVVAMAIVGRLGEALGPVDVVPVAAGLGVGGAWLVATHIGHAVLCRIFPGFLDQVTELYSLREGDRVATMVGPVVAMGVAEEVFFRGLVQGAAGLVVAVVIYGAVQVVAGKWALVLAAVLGGIVWGLLYWWTDGLLAPVLAHVLWTGALTFVWPLRGCGAEPGAADAAPTANERDRAASSQRGSDPAVTGPAVSGPAATGPTVNGAAEAG